MCIGLPPQWGKADAFYLLCQSEICAIPIQCSRGGKSDQYWSASEPVVVRSINQYCSAL